MQRWHKLLAALSLCLVLAALLPVTARAATREEEIMQELSSMYRRTMAANGLEEMGGYCGVLAGYELYYLGVDAWPNPHDGREEFDIYKNLEYSTGGYKIRAYPASKYSLEETLNLITHGGTRDAYNILVGFEWTNTESGGDFGHAVVVPAIIDGVVYSVESYYTSFNTAAGVPFRCSIPEFVAEYSSWTVLDGVIWFGEKEYVNFCEEYATDMFVQARANAQLLALPGAPNLEGQRVLRPVASGERLRVTALYQNPEGQYFYRVEEEGRIGYIAAKSMARVRINTENLRLTNLRVPELLQEGGHFSLRGKITAGDGLLTGARVVVTDGQNAPVMAASVEREGRLIRLEDGELNSQMDFSKLAPGVYTYEVYGETANAFDVPLLKEEQVVQFRNSVLLHSSEFRVLGKDEEPPEPVEETDLPEEPALAFEEGWNWTGDTWYYYQDGAPRSGWFCDSGINYYLNEDGSAVTGWVTINGQARYFTETGAMRTGWVDGEEGRLYMLSNGVAARGWRTVGGDRYYFLPETGVMLTASWFEQDGEQFYFLPEGRAATGWTETPEGSFFFGDDGVLQAETVTMNGQTYFRAAGGEK